MGKSDWEYFNCSEQHEHDYVVSQYEKLNGIIVREYLEQWCEDGTIDNSTHKEVYDLIEEELDMVRK
jgi:hypothetical protein